jgi:uracil-DNA glycosylase family protein
VTAADLIPAAPTLTKLREHAAGCKACPLWERGTQTVFGEGRASAEVMLVGEQPGDQEDKAGKPFVGPAGRLLDRALEEAGIERDDAYVTNAVKHFKWEPKGKRRIHAKPTWSGLSACRPWLEAELGVISPRVLVCLGASAAQTLLGKQFRLTQHRSEWVDSDLAEFVTATIHPSAILRQRDEESREAEFERFVADLRFAASVLASNGGTSKRAATAARSQSS